jgi:hypothetical protein
MSRYPPKPNSYTTRSTGILACVDLKKLVPFVMQMTILLATAIEVHVYSKEALKLST